MEAVCDACKLPITPTKPDPCLGYLPGVKSACCGHGDPSMAYVQFDSGHTIRGAGGFDHVHAEKPLNRYLSIRCAIHGPILYMDNPWEPIKGAGFSVACQRCERKDGE